MFSCSCRPLGLPGGAQASWPSFAADLLPARTLSLFSSFLKSAAYAEPKEPLFLVKEKRKTVDDLVATCVGIISINEAKRHVENRHLDPKLGAHAGAVVGKLRKQTLIEAHDGVGLGLATKEYLLQTEGQSRKRIDGTKPERFIKLGS